MVVRLQRAAPLALSYDDSCVDHLVKLAEVEEPAPERQALVPQPAQIRGFRCTFRTEVDDLVAYLPQPFLRIVRRRIAESAWTMHLAERISRASEPVLRPDARPKLAEEGVLAIAGPGMRQGPEHRPEHKAREDGEADIVHDDEGLECPRPADGPWLPASLAVDGVHVQHRDGVHGCDRDGDVDGEDAIVDAAWDLERRREGSEPVGRFRRREDLWFRVWREFEE